MSKKNMDTLNVGQATPPRFNAATTEDEIKLALASCQSWDSVRLVIFDLLGKKSEELLQRYEGSTEAPGQEWIDTMHLLSEYRDHLCQCLHTCSCAIERLAIIGEHLAQSMGKVEQSTPVVRSIHRETIH